MLLRLRHFFRIAGTLNNLDEIWERQPPTDKLITIWEKLYKGQGSRIWQKIRIDVKHVLPRSEWLCIHAAAERWYDLARSLAHSYRQACLSGPKMFFFRPAGATHCSDKREVWHGGADHSPYQISCLSGQKCGNTAPKRSKFGMLPTNLPSPGATRLHNFYEILSVCTRLYVAFKFLIWSLSGQTTKL